MIKLKELPVEPRSGVSTRVRQALEGETNACVLLKAAHFNQYGMFDSTARASYADLDSHEIERHRLNSRSMLVQSRGNFKACLPPSDVESRAYVASTNFVVVELKDSEPTELIYHLYGSFSSHVVLASLLRKIRGTTVPTVNLKDILETEVHTPDPARLGAYAQLVQRFHDNVRDRLLLNHLEQTSLELNLR